MKRLVLENKDAIKFHELFANQLVDSSNSILNKFKTSHNHFGQPINEPFAFELVSNPVQTFDNLLLANSTIKPLSGKSLDVVKLAEILGINRSLFIQDITIVLPGSKSQYNPHGTTAIFQLTGKNKALVSWKDDKFVLNEDQLLTDYEAFRVYATSKEQNELIDRWESLAEALNKHKDFVSLDNIDCNRIGYMVKLDFNNGKFEPKYRELAGQIKAMAVN